MFDLYIAKIVPFWYPRWPSWNSSNNISFGNTCWIMCGSRGGGGGGGGGGGTDPLLKNHKNKGFLSNNDPDPWRITKFVHHRPSSETPLKWCFAGRPRWPTFNDIWILSPHINWKKTNFVWVGPTLTKLFGSVHVVLNRDMMGGKRFRNVSHLDIHSSNNSWTTSSIVLKLGGRCKGNMAIQNC